MASTLGKPKLGQETRGETAVSVLHHSMTSKPPSFFHRFTALLGRRDNVTRINTFRLLQQQLERSPGSNCYHRPRNWHTDCTFKLLALVTSTGRTVRWVCGEQGGVGGGGDYAASTLLKAQKLHT